MKNNTWRSKLIKRWIFSGTQLTLFSLIILPIVVVLSAYLHDYVNSLVKDVFFPQYPAEIVALNYSVIILQWLVISIILFIFPPYPFPISVKNYFKTRGYENAVIEYDLVKIILYISVPLFITLTVVLPVLAGKIGSYGSVNIRIALNEPIFRFIQNYLLLIVFAAILKLIVALIRKDFRLYYAKGCFKKLIMQSSGLNEANVMNYLTKGLKAYNSYIKRNMNLQIKDLNRIICKIAVTSEREKETIITKLVIAFNKDDKQTMEYFHELHPLLQSNNLKLENETLRPLRKLYDYSQPLMPNEFLSEQSFIEKIRENIAFAATIPPLIISVIEIYARIRGVS